MKNFNFHHHNTKIFEGIYNLDSKEQFSSYYFSSGIHPKDIGDDWKEKLEGVKKTAQLGNCFAIGECGLDSRVGASPELQKEVFLKQVQLANEIGKPLIIHCVRKFPEIIYLKKFGQTAWIIHGFNKNPQLAQELLEAGFYLSFGKPLLHSLSLQQIFINTPSSRFFLETDDDNFEIVSLYQKAAELKNITVENIENQIFENLKEIKNDR